MEELDGTHGPRDLRALLEAAGIKPACRVVAPIHVAAICCDSRTVEPGALFVGVSGASADGIAFVDDAIARGAAAVLTDRDVRSDGVPVMRVDDARLALARLAAVFYGIQAAQRDGGFQVVGVTGTNGKSTVAYMVRAVLRASGAMAALLGTIEYDLVDRCMPAALTTPDPILLARHLAQAHRAGARYGVIEVSSHSLTQKRTDGIDFAVGVFTNLTQDHLDYHRSFDDYLNAKKRLFDRLGPEASAVINHDDPVAAQMVADCGARVRRYSINGGADVCVRILREDRAGTDLTLYVDGRSVDVHLTLCGRHNIANALAATGATFALGLDLPTIARGLESLNHVPGRLQRIDSAELGFDVFVDYAHTDDALRNVLTAVRPLTCGRLWCLFGCGGDRDRTKRPKMARAVAEHADAFIITSDNPRTEDPLAIIDDVERGLTADDRHRATTIPDRARAIRHAVEQLGPGDALVIAGKGHENYQILGTERIHFDDAEMAAAAIAQRREKLACGL